MTEQGATRRIVILGAGAMGCLFAARLALSGNEVTLVDIDQARIDVINELGLLLRDEQGDRHVDLQAAKAADVDGSIDLLIVFTKGNHTCSAVESVAHLAADKPIALSLQNGIGNAEILAAGFGWDHTLFGTAHIPADLSPPNEVSTHMPNALALGGASEDIGAMAQDIAELLTSSGFDAVASGNIENTVWDKLAFNAALNAPAMICQKTNGGLDNPHGLRIARAVIAEAVAVAQAKGIELDAAKIDASVRSALKGHASHKASMLQDREAGRQTEIAMINGAIVREGEMFGIPTPVCATLTDLVQLIES